MEFDWIPKWWGIVSYIISGLAALIATVISLWLSKTFARREDLKKVESGMDELSHRVTGLETRVEALPTQEEVTALRLEMAENRGCMKALTEKLTSVNHLVQLLLEQQMKDK
ncbi:DUF2730 family protein [Aeromonas tecta]|uniref:DUF2730 family protein n=1 Tax=Aeromonas tecta TaxID=324617 RepID=UPI0006821443|nr:DUF2730 family protein [Aeromonas tecta]